MDKIALVLKYLNLYAHQAHNLIKGSTFFQDHEFLGELYAAYDVEYDQVVERSIGLKKPVNIKKVNGLAAQQLPDDKTLVMPKCFEDMLASEIYLCKIIEQIAPQSSQGTMNMLAQIADNSEVRQYKIQQRLSK